MRLNDLTKEQRKILKEGVCDDFKYYTHLGRKIVLLEPVCLLHPKLNNGVRNEFCTFCYKWKQDIAQAD